MKQRFPERTRFAMTGSSGNPFLLEINPVQLLHGLNCSCCFMKTFRKIIRLFFYFLLGLLASVGIAFGGGVPVPPPGRKEEVIEVQAEEETTEEGEMKKDKS